MLNKNFTCFGARSLVPSAKDKKRSIYKDVDMLTPFRNKIITIIALLIIGSSLSYAFFKTGASVPAPSNAPVVAGGNTQYVGQSVSISFNAEPFVTTYRLYENSQFSSRIIYEGSTVPKAVTKTYTSPGTYYLVYMVCNKNGCSSNSPSTRLSIKSAPTISSIANQTTEQGTSTRLIPFTVADSSVPANQLIVTATTSNSNIVTVGDIELGGSGSNRTVRVTPLPSGTTGTVTITIKVSNGGATSSRSFNVKVNPGSNATLPAWLQKGGSVSDWTMDNSVPAASDFMGAIAGSGSADGGSASYQIPIVIPPVMNGMQPSVSLNYSSRSGLGIAGVGWNLSAGGAISRCPSTLAQDGYARGLNYSNDDKLCFNGQRLVTLSGTYGLNGAKYTTEIDSFITVTQVGHLSSSNSHFTVSLPNGRTQKYGNSSASRVVASGVSQPLTWLLASEVDGAGNNAVNYNYTNYGVGEVLLTNISYQGGRSVKFTYEAVGSGYYRSSFLAGGQTRMTKRLDKIQTYVDNSLVRSYNMLYTLSNGSDRLLLDGVEECGYDGPTLCRNAYNGFHTEFEYSDNEVFFQLEPLQTSSGTNIVSVSQSNLVPQLSIVLPRGDIDGNGSPDWGGYLLNAEGDIESTNNYRYNPCSYSYMLGQRQCVEADFNLDGITDTWRNSNGYLELGYTIRGAQSVQWKGSSAVRLYGQGDPKEGQIVNIGDYNADGWPDIVIMEGTISTRGYIDKKVFLYFHTRNTDAPYSASSSKKILVTELQDRDSVSYIGDIDGDGLPDLGYSRLLKPAAESQPTMTHVMLNKMDSSGGISFDKLAIRDNDNGSGDGYENFAMFVDINGDGLSDWIGWLENNHNKLFAKINKGAGTFSNPMDLGFNMPLDIGYVRPQSSAHPSEPINKPKFEGAIKQMDIDGDGLVELIFPSADVADMLVESCYTFNEIKSLTTYQTTRCGRGLRNPYRMDTPNTILFVSPDPSWDRNVYRYKALSFTEHSDGTFTAQLKDTDLVGTATHSAVVDAFGNGLQDLVFTYGCADTSCEIKSSAAKGVMAGIQPGGLFFNRNYGATESNNPSKSDYQALDLLVKAENGMGYINRWKYAPLSSDAPGEDFYTPDHQIVDDKHFLFTSNMYVVSKFEHSTDDGQNGVDYKYTSAMYNTKGRGFRGFKSIETIDQATSIRSKTTFMQKFPYSSRIIEQAQYVGSRIVPFSIQTNEWGINPAHNVAKSFSVVNTSSQNITCDLDATICNSLYYVSKSNKTININDFDAFGNPRKIINRVEDAFGVYISESLASFSLANRNFPNRYDWKKEIKYPVQRKDGLIAGTSNLDIASWVITTVNQWNTTYRKPEKVTVSTSDNSKAPVTETVFNSLGLPSQITITAPSQTRVQSVTYDSKGMTRTQTNAMGHAATSVLSAKTGQPTTTIDANGVSATTTYDAFARPVAISSAGVSTQYVRYRRPDSGAPLSAVARTLIKQAGSPDSNEYKSITGKSVMSKTRNFDGDFMYQSSSYDARGLMMSETNVYQTSSLETTYEYDAIGRPVLKKSPKTNGGYLYTTYEYDGLTTRIYVDGLPEMSRTHNALKQLVRTVDAIGGVTQYAYDAIGNPVIIEDANNNQIKAKYDALGRKEWVNDPNQGVTNFDYNAFGDLVSETDANGAIINYGIDKLGRVTSRGGASSASFVWDTKKKGMLTRQTENGVTKSFEYDALSRVSSSTVTIDAIPYTTSYGYHGSSGQPSTMTYPNGLVVGYEYNSRGYLTREYNVASGYTYKRVTEFNEQGLEKRFTLGDSSANINQTNIYSSATGQMISTIAQGNTGAVRGNIHFLQYEYDDFGNLESQQNMLSGMRATESYDYDDIHRLTNSSINANGTSATINYSYDAVGNLTSKSDYASNYTYTLGTNRLYRVSLVQGGTDTFAYDSKGNQTHRDGRREVTYNVFNKPTKISKGGSDITLTYGADLMRVKQVRVVNNKAITTHYVGKHYEIEKSAGKWTETAYIGGSAIVKNGNDNANQKIRFALRDRLGSAVTFVDENGRVTGYRFFDPFGKPRNGDWRPLSVINKVARLMNNTYEELTSEGEASPTRRGFTDHEHLDEAELIHMNGRVYDYNLGRFLSVDPFVHGGSQGINPYSYIMNNPLAGTDPSGYSPEKETVEITSETEFFKDGDGNQYVSAGDGSGDLISVDSVKRSGSVSSGGITTSYSVTTNSNGSFSGSISSTQGSSVTNTVFAGDIGSQNSLSKDDPVSSVGNTTGCETVSCNSSLYSELDSYIQNNVSNGGADSSWFAAASEVTSLQGIGAIDAPNLGFITDPEENYFRFVTHSLVSHNYQAFSEIRKGGFGGLSGKRLDDLLVVREQLLVEMLTDRHFGNNSQARANVLSGLSASMNHNNPARRLMSIPGRTGRALERELGDDSFNIGNLQHRIKVGISMVDEIRAERGN